jgi:hypothetical protein
LSYGAAMCAEMLQPGQFGGMVQLLDIRRIVTT